MIIARCQMTDRSLFITIITAAASDKILAAFIMLFYHQMDNLSFSAGLHTGPLFGSWFRAVTVSVIQQFVFHLHQKNKPIMALVCESLPRFV